MSPTQGERVATLEQRISDHESRCEERLAEIKATAAATQKAVEGLKTRFFTVVLALLAWALAQVYATVQAKPSPPPVEVHATSR